jgi:hypothetical protein
VPGLMHVNLGGIPHQRHRVHRRLRHRRYQSGQRPLRGHLCLPQQHL